MLYNIKAVYLHCVFHGIRFKVNEDWVSVTDTLLFLYTFLVYSHHFSFARTKENEAKRKFVVCIFLPTPVLFSAKQKELANAQKALPLNGKKKRPETSEVDVYI